MENLHEKIGERLRLLRCLSGKTQKEVADELGVSQTILACYEKGSKKMTVERLVDFAKFYNVTVDDIIQVNLTETEFNMRKEELIMRHRLWYREFGQIELTASEERHLIHFTKYILHMRENK